MTLPPLPPMEFERLTAIEFERLEPETLCKRCGEVTDYTDRLCCPCFRAIETARIQPERDAGDEDDPTTERMFVRQTRLFQWRFIEGPIQSYYPAYVLPALPDHDPGDEEPELALRVPDWLVEDIERSWWRFVR